MSAKPIPLLHTIADVAKFMSVSTRTVRRWIAAKNLVAYRFGRAVRVSEIDLKAFIERNRAV